MAVLNYVTPRPPEVQRSLLLGGIGAACIPLAVLIGAVGVDLPGADALVFFPVLLLTITGPIVSTVAVVRRTSRTGLAWTAFGLWWCIWLWFGVISYL